MTDCKRANASSSSSTQTPPPSQETSIHLSPRDQQTLVEAIANPPEPNEALRTAAWRSQVETAEQRHVSAAKENEFLTDKGIHVFGDGPSADFATCPHPDCATGIAGGAKTMLTVRRRWEADALEIVVAGKRDLFPNMSEDDGGQLLVWILDLCEKVSAAPPSVESGEPYLHINGRATPEEVRPVVTELLKRMAEAGDPPQEKS